MTIQPTSLPVSPSPSDATYRRLESVSEIAPAKSDAGDEKLRETFGQFVGETFFAQMLQAMRSTLGKPAYFHGGRAEEVFQGQLDQVLSEKLAEGSSARFSDPMFELFQLQRRS